MDRMSVRDAEGKNPQCIVATAHYGNWEVAGNFYVWISVLKVLISEVHFQCTDSNTLAVSTFIKTPSVSIKIQSVVSDGLL